MRTYFKLLIPLLLFCAGAFGQGKPINVYRSAPSVTVNDAYLHAWKGFTLPIVSDTAHGVNGSLDSVGSLIYAVATAKIYQRDSVPTGGHVWTPVGTGSGGSGADSATYYTKYRSDTARANMYAALATKVANYLGVSSLGIGSHAARPTTGPGLYYDTDSTSLFFVNTGVYNNLFPAFALFVRSQAPAYGDTSYIQFVGNKLLVAPFADSAGNCIRHIVYPDGRYVWYSTCTTPAFDSLTTQNANTSGAFHTDSFNVRKYQKIYWLRVGNFLTPINVGDSVAIGGSTPQHRLHIIGDMAADFRNTNPALTFSNAHTFITRQLTTGGTLLTLNDIYAVGAVSSGDSVNNLNLYTADPGGISGKVLNFTGLNLLGGTYANINNLTGINIQSATTANSFVGVTLSVPAATNNLAINSTGSAASYFGGAIGIANSTPAASSLLDIVSTSKGVLLPRMTTTQMVAISSPTSALTVFNTDSVATGHPYAYWDGVGSVWRYVGSGFASGGAGGSTLPAGSLQEVQINRGQFGTVKGFFADTVTRMVHAHQLRANKQVMIGPDSVQTAVIGTVFDDQFKRSSLGANYTFGNATTTMSFPSSDHMHIVVTYSSFSNYIEYTQPQGFNLDTLYATVVCQDTASTSYGFGIGQESHNSFYARGYLAQYSFAGTAGGTKGKILYYTDDGTTPGVRYSGATTGIAMQPGDTIDAKSIRQDSMILNTVRNRRTGVSATYSFFYLSNNTTTSPPNQIPNVGNWRMYFFGGTFDVLDFGAYSPEHTGGVAWLQNSIGTGYNQTYWNGGYQTLLRPNNRALYYRFGGPGDRSNEALIDSNLFWLGKPRLVYWSLAENDLNNSVSLATFSTNVQTTLNSIAFHGAKAVIVGGCPQTGKLIKPYNDTLQAIAGRRGILYINLYDTLRNGTDYKTSFSIDGIHANTAGNGAIATQFILQDTNFSYSHLVMPNLPIANTADTTLKYVTVDRNGGMYSMPTPLPADPTDTATRIVAVNKYGQLVSSRRQKDTALYIHQTPTTPDTGSVNILGSFHGGSRPYAGLHDAASWISNTGGSVDQTLILQGTASNDYPGITFVDHTGTKTGFLYVPNSGATFNPGYTFLESNVQNKGIRLMGGLGTSRGNDYDAQVDSANFRFHHNAHYDTRPKYGSWIGADSLAIPTLTQVDSAMRKIAHDSAGTGGFSTTAPHTWTNTQDMTGATLTVATQTAHDSTTKATNDLYVDRAVAQALAALPTFASGLYTPTVTNGANVTTNASAQGHFIRVGSQVTVDGSLGITPTIAVTPTTFQLSLPTASGTFANGIQASGIGGTTFADPIKPTIISTVGSATVTVAYTPQSGGASQLIYFHFQYQIQ